MSTCCKSLGWLLSLLISATAWGQQKSNTFQQLMDYSRPGKYHAILAPLTGEWTFEGRHYSGHTNPDSNTVVMKFSGTLQRKAFGNGRFFLVEITGGKLQIPVQDGKMMEANFSSMETEGYDNVKQRFVLTVINNHIGSDIQYSEGTYDSSAHTITYKAQVELLPGKPEMVNERFVIIDADHYRMEYYNEEGAKVHELVCTRQGK